MTSNDKFLAGGKDVTRTTEFGAGPFGLKGPADGRALAPGWRTPLAFGFAKGAGARLKHESFYL